MAGSSLAMPAKVEAKSDAGFSPTIVLGIASLRSQ